MRPILTTLTLTCLCWGCVAGPDDIAEDERRKSNELPVVASEPLQPVIEDEAERGEFQETASGLRYRILREGKDLKPLPTSQVTVHYRGWLDDGTEFDSSYSTGRPFGTPLNGVIAGWTEGLQLIGEGGKIELDIPSQLAYGENGFPPVIPPNARLHFDVELITVVQ